MEYQARETSAQLPSHVKRIHYSRQISLSFARPYIGNITARDQVRFCNPAIRFNFVTSSRRTIQQPNTTSQSAPYLKRYHVIPAMRLKMFFNTALSNSNNINNYHESRKLLTVLSNLANRTFKFYQPYAPGQLDSDTMNFLQRFHNIITYDHLKPIDSAPDGNNIPRMIDHLFLSMPFNIFEAPQSRSDDPGPEFEQLARAIIGQKLFDELRIIDKDMTSYNRQASVANFDCIVSRLISLISQHTWHTTTYDSILWENEENGKYHIKQNNEFLSFIRKREINKGYNSDPYCFGTKKYLTDYGDEIYNVRIVGIAFDRVLNAKGFYPKNYDSWKHWYDKSHWCRRLLLPQRGIIELGRSMVSDDGKPYGCTFNDGSFAVGIIGDDVKYGNDNWKTLGRTDWGTGDKYAGQIFFDKNGQPVALVISNFRNGLVGSGWSFIYNNGNWEYESKDDWHERRFADSTLSLDSRAPRFLIDNKGYTY